MYLQLFDQTRIMNSEILILPLDDLGVIPSKPNAGIARKTLLGIRGVFSPVNEFTAPLYRVHP